METSQDPDAETELHKTDPETDPSPTNGSPNSKTSIYTNLPARRMSSEPAVEPLQKKSSVKSTRRSSELSRESGPFFVESEKELGKDDSAAFLPSTSKSYTGTDNALGIHQSSAQRVRETYYAVEERLSEPVGDGLSIYDRLKAAVKYVLRTSDKTAYNSFEQILKSQDQPPIDRVTGNQAARDAEWKEAKIYDELLKPEGALEERVDAQVDEETGKSKIPNILRLYPYLRNAGISRLFSHEKASALSVAIRKLLDNDPKILKIKFWGVIFGSKEDYYILEAEAEPPDDEEEEEEPAETTEEAPAEEEAEENPENEGFTNLPPIPKPMLRPLPPLAKEPNGTGVNTKAYFVTNKLDGNWVRLPAVTPDQIIVSRKIQKGFTGDLAAKVPTFPSFPGTEAHYLHAQLVRISSATHICPNGYYLLESDEDVEEGSAPPLTLTENPEYQPPTTQQLSQPHMKFWTHYGQYILRQGRTFFYDAFEANKDEEEEEEEEDEEGEAKPKKAKYPLWYPEKAEWYEPEQNVPPPLCSVMSDMGIDGYPPWSIHFGSKIFPSQSFLIVRSNLWPGAVTILYNQGKEFVNLYFGRGLKYRSQFVPKLPGHVKHEKYDPTLHEETDPTPEEEEEIRRAAGLDEENTEGQEEGDEETEE